jgi:light-regulated signal transduction histidine kinase (bacteriophytochrome)
MIVHELRAPLRALRCYASMLDEEYGAGLAPEARTLLTKVIGAVREMDRMTVDLLALARAGIPDGSMSWVDTSEVVRQVLADLAPQCTGRVSFRFGELCKCLGHAGLLRQVWTNLISNALKFTRERDPALIELGSFPARGVSTWFVRDNGIGFDSRHARDLFVPFRRLHDARQVEGHGLGLAIVRRIVECHGGRLWAESRPGEGATFYFTLGGAVTPGE